MTSKVVAYFLISSLVIFLLYLSVFNGDFRLTTGLYISFYILNSVIFLKIYTRRKFDLFSPPFLFITAFLLYSLAGGMFVLHFNSDRMGKYLSDFSVYKYYFLCLISINFYQLGILLIQFKRIRTFNYFNDKHFTPFGIIIYSLLLSTPFLTKLMDRFNFTKAISYQNILIEKLAFRENEAQGIVDVLFVLGPLTCILYALSLVFLQKKYNPLIRVIAFSIFMLPIISAFTSGQRSEIVSLLLIPIILYHFYIKKFKISRLSLISLVLIGASLFFGMKAMEVMRVKESYSEMIPFLLQEIDRKGWQLFSLSNVGELMTSSNQIVLIEAMNKGQQSLSYGATFLNDLGAFIPRSIWPGRPLPLSEYFASIFYSSVYEKGGGFGLFITMESFWAFGYLGSCIYFLLFGMFVQYGYKLLTRIPNLFKVFLYAQFFKVFVVTSSRSGILLGIKAFLMSILTFLIVSFLLKFTPSFKVGIKKKQSFSRS